MVQLEDANRGLNFVISWTLLVFRVSGVGQENDAKKLNRNFRIATKRTIEDVRSRKCVALNKTIRTGAECLVFHAVALHIAVVQ